MSRVAVVGGGISGLTAVWRLGLDHEVVLFESEARPGFGAHSMVHQDTSMPIDTPLRVFYRGYYPNLSGLYEELGVESEWVNYESSFSELNSPSYFSYRNLRLGGMSIPYLPPRSISRTAVQIVAGLARFHLLARRHQRAGDTHGLTVGDYLERHRFSETFVQQFLLPAFCGICTCSADAMRNYPIDFVIDYLSQGVMWQGVHRVKNGVQDVTDRVCERAAEVRCQVRIEQIEHHGGGVRLTDHHGRQHQFDQVVIAAQAPNALAMLGPGFEQEKRQLSDIDFEASEVAVHTDATLAPRDRTAWRSVNFILPDMDLDATPMATIWLNRVMPNEWQEPVFETWNPILEPAEDKVLQRVTFTRPLANQRSILASRNLTGLQASPESDTRRRRVWFCGSYLASQIPLLEGAVTSSVNAVASMRRARTAGSQAPA